MKRARVPFKTEMFFEISAVDLENIEFKILHNDHNIAMKTNVTSLLDLLDKLRFAVESVISEL